MPPQKGQGRSSNGFNPSGWVMSSPQLSIHIHLHMAPTLKQCCVGDYILMLVLVIFFCIFYQRAA